jgi:hypothetical protein
VEVESLEELGNQVAHALVAEVRLAPSRDSMGAEWELWDDAPKVWDEAFGDASPGAAVHEHAVQ